MSSAYFNKLKSELENDLKSLTVKTSEPLDRLTTATALIAKTLRELKGYVLENNFPDQASEIAFFKAIKPGFYALQIYEIGRFNLLIHQPVGTDETELNYLQEEVRQITRFFQQNAFHYHYYRFKITELDHIYFTRNQECHFQSFPEIPLLEPDYSTEMDYLFAKFMAWERLLDDLDHRIALLSKSALPAVSGSAQLHHDLKWTGDGINLVEVAYGIWLTGQLNHGTAGISEIISWLEANLQVKIGRAYRRWTAISGRKRISTTRYIDQMREAVQLRHQEENSLIKKTKEI
ncbi:RteC domain-containing protein [Mucilaginibacter sp. PAMB04274]|uniref:RteC domain-containing protein n=1 Tax=Mucilaginibacter sp. PAMB04274 TaxID=3138568 RepID=UPI0031F67E25